MGSTLTCLLIDDDLDEHEFFQIILNKTCLPVECIYTRSCNEAIAIAEKLPQSEFKYIIVDWMLLSKIELGCSRELKHVSAFSESQFIIYSMMDPPKVIMEDYSLNALHFLKKDHSFELIAEEIRKVFAE
jgi:DNA-binding NarL/FixJ family response regulator